ncbi:MAG: flagellar M-ring protein FliF [Herminiimonas sp.]|nr:flagellar M-ring protein FliF [Herminiimonas sp.]
MAVVVEGTPAGMGGMAGFTASNAARNLALAIGAALVVALMVGAWLWSQQPDYRVLFSNFSDRDGGAIVTSLQQMNVPYKFAEGGGAILVPAAQVYDARLKLASQGLPKGGSVGFELMENQKLGVSQFLEQVNFQRALEGELARSIQSVGAVQSARVHLALPKASVFVRDQQKPTASVILNLNQGRTLDPGQVSAIVHLVASSVPELSSKSVTVIDQSGNLLSDADKATSANGLDPTQLKYVQDLQQSIVKRIESIISPLVGPNNVRAEATADIDFSRSEQAAEVYKPNQAPNTGAIRSMQTNETGAGAAANASGVPGALSNQPPAPATAPITGGAPAPGTPAAKAAADANAHREATTNYEVDKTIRYVQQPMGGVKRISVAVVVNYKRDVDKAGKVSNRALTEAEKTQITDLVKEAMGFNKERGDTLNIANSPFAGAEAQPVVDVPIWKNPETLQTGKEVGKYLLGAAVILYLFFAFLKPMLKKLMAGPPKPVLIADDDDDVVELSSGGEPMGAKVRGYAENLEAAKLLAKQDPKVVANVVKAWVGNE